MFLDTSDFLVVDHSGAELRVTRDRERVSCITSEGNVEYFNATMVLDLLQSDRISYFHIPGVCVLMISELGGKLFRFFFNRARIEQTINIERTEFLSEGFDYSVWFNHESGPVLCHELGICKFDNEGLLLWQTKFDEIQVLPEVAGNYLIYHENEKDVARSLVDGSIN